MSRAELRSGRARPCYNRIHACLGHQLSERQRRRGARAGAALPAGLRAAARAPCRRAARCLRRRAGPAPGQPSADLYTRESDHTIASQRASLGMALLRFARAAGLATADSNSTIPTDSNLQVPTDSDLPTQDTLVRTANLREGDRVIDATLGLGADALLAAQATRARVLAFEKSGVLAAFTQAALRRPSGGPELRRAAGRGRAHRHPGRRSPRPAGATTRQERRGGAVRSHVPQPGPLPARLPGGPRPRRARAAFPRGHRAGPPRRHPRRLDQGLPARRRAEAIGYKNGIRRPFLLGWLDAL